MPSDSTRPRRRRPDFPLRIHKGTGYWCKKIRGHVYYFGKVADDHKGVADDGCPVSQQVVRRRTRTASSHAGRIDATHVGRADPLGSREKMAICRRRRLRYTSLVSLAPDIVQPREQRQQLIEILQARDIFLTDDFPSHAGHASHYARYSRGAQVWLFPAFPLL